MRLQINDYGFDSQLPDNAEVALIQSSHKMFSILSDAIYKDKILAVIRELSCNAYDAMCWANKKNVPFRVKLPSQMEPSFRIEDDGIGIHPSEMRNIYLTYGNSTKTDRDDQIGALGLGSKSPFAYTKSSFIVKNRWHTPPTNDSVMKPVTEYTYFIFINEKGVPAISFVGSQEVDAEIGITVELAVKQEDIRTFFNRADRFFRYWKDTMPEFIDYTVQEIITTKIDKVIDGGSWYLEERDRYADFKGAVAIMGNVPYPILVDSIPGLPEDLKIIAKNSFVIDFPMGSLAFQPSREDLSYDEFTCKNIIDRLSKVAKEVASKFKDQIFVAGQSQLQFRKNFYESLTKFSKVIRAETRSSNDTDVSWVCKFIFGTTDKGSVTYDNFTYSIAELFNRSIKQVTAGYQPFNIIRSEVRGRNQRVYLRACTDLNVECKAEIDHETIFGKKNNGYLGRKIRVGDRYTFDWQSKSFSRRKDAVDYTPLQRVFLCEANFEFETINDLYIHTDDVTFIINDEGGVGDAKFKAMLDSRHQKGEMFFIRHNQKEIDLIEIGRRVSDFIKAAGLQGAKMVFSSNLDDHRAPIIREKTDSNTAKLNYTSFIRHIDQGKHAIDVYMNRRISIDHVTLPTYTGHTMKTFSLDELANSSKPWAYVLKNRSKKEIFDETNSGTVRSVLTSDDRLHFRLAVAMGLFDDVMYSVVENTRAKTTNPAFPPVDHVYTVLVLNEGQVAWLMKKGVKLVGLRKQIEAKMKEKLAAHNFIEDIEEEAIMESLEVVDTFHDNLDQTTISNITSSWSDSLFAQLLKSYDDYTKNKGAKLMSYTWMTLYRAFVDRFAVPNATQAGVINQDLMKSYPILKMVSFNGLDRNDFNHLLQYIELSDKKSFTGAV